MRIDSADSAAEFVRDWLRPARPGLGPSSSNVLRFREAARTQERIAGLCGERQPIATAGHLEAAKVLSEAADRLEAELADPVSSRSL